MTSAATSMLEAVSGELPWDLVVTFSTMPRWRPDDVARSAREIVGRLEAHGVPVTVHEPSLYLSIPYRAEVRSPAGTFAAKPPAYSTDCREGREAELVYVPATISQSISNLFDKNQDAALSSAERIRGKIVISEGFCVSAQGSGVRAEGGARRDRGRTPAPTPTGASAPRSGARRTWTICPASPAFRSAPSTTPTAQS